MLDDLRLCGEPLVCVILTATCKTAWHCRRGCGHAYPGAMCLVHELQWADCYRHGYVAKGNHPTLVCAAAATGKSLTAL